MGITKESIPVLGIPIVNGFHWINRLIESIDYPIKNVVIIDNSGGKDKEFVNNLDLLVEKGSSYIESFKVCHLPANIGVAGAWNLIIKSYLMEPYWVISNHDIAFVPGVLDEIAMYAEDPEIGMIHPHEGIFSLGSYAIFAIKDWVIQKYGLFDENFYPAYGEDTDYIMKLINNPIKAIKGLTRSVIHGSGTSTSPFSPSPEEDEYQKHGRQTAQVGGVDLTMKLNKVNEINFEYCYEKWGPGWRSCHPYKYPMNNENIPNDYTRFDLEYARRKYLGF